MRGRGRGKVQNEKVKVLDERGGVEKERREHDPVPFFRVRRGRRGSGGVGKRGRYGKSGGVRRKEEG